MALVQLGMVDNIWKRFVLAMKWESLADYLRCFCLDKAHEYILSICQLILIQCIVLN